MIEISNFFLESADVKKKFINENKTQLQEIIQVILNCLKKWNKILICWNWWSAADAQHFAAELIWRYKTERISLPAIALTTDTSIITAIGNDYGYDAIFTKQVSWLWNEWDILIWFSTSWNSNNIIQAIKVAKDKWITTIWLLGKTWWKIKDITDHQLIVPSDNTARIQECHMTIYHTICEFIDEEFTSNE